MISHEIRRLRTLFTGTVPKHSEFPESNEDRFYTCDTRQLYVLSDGASESFNSSLWADIVVEAWATSRPRRNVLRWLKDAIRAYESRSDRAHMSWSQEAAFERGSFASLLAVEAVEDSELRVTAIGDSVALLVADGEIRWSFPYDSADQFQARPHLLSTINERNLTPFFLKAARAVRANEPTGPCHARMRWSTGDRLLCVTDALGEWLLRECENHSDRLNHVLSVTSEDSLSALVDEARASGTMRRDDTTLIILGAASDVTSDS